MKKWFFLLLVFPGMSLKALPVGNPSFPQLLQEGFIFPQENWVNGRLGYEGTFVSQGRLKFSNKHQGAVDNFEERANSGSVTCNIENRLDLYGTLGGAYFSSECSIEQEPDIFDHLEWETKNHLFWTLGVRGLLFEWGKVTFGLGGRYFRGHFPLEWLEKNGISISDEKGNFSLSSWQVDFSASYKIQWMIPYIGVKYSHVKACLELPEKVLLPHHKFTLENRHHYGMALGCTLTTGKFFMLNIEGRLFDEEAVTVSGDFRF